MVVHDDVHVFEMGSYLRVTSHDEHSLLEDPEQVAHEESQGSHVPLVELAKYADPQSVTQIPLFKYCCEVGQLMQFVVDPEHVAQFEEQLTQTLLTEILLPPHCVTHEVPSRLVDPEQAVHEVADPEHAEQVSEHMVQTPLSLKYCVSHSLAHVELGKSFCTPAHDVQFVDISLHAPQLVSHCLMVPVEASTKYPEDVVTHDEESVHSLHPVTHCEQMFDVVFW